MQDIAELQKELEARQARAAQMAQQQADAKALEMAQRNADIAAARLKLANERAQASS